MQPQKTVTHHIDGNPKNNTPKNLIALPPSVHSKLCQIAVWCENIKKPSLFFIGKAGSGKTALANHAVTAHGYVRAAFGDGIKQIAIEEFGMNPHRKRRHLLQTIGRVGRALDEFIWIRRLLSTISKAEGPVVIDDCRLLNEFLVLKLLGMRGIYLECPANRRRTRARDFPRADAEKDVTEMELESLKKHSDFVLDTSKPLQTSLSEMDEIIRHLMLQTNF